MLFRYSQANSNRTKTDYLNLFVKIIKTEFNKVTFGKGIFVTSTPSNGGDGTDIESHPNSANTGDGTYKYHLNKHLLDDIMNQYLFLF